MKKTVLTSRTRMMGEYTPVKAKSEKKPSNVEKSRDAAKDAYAINKPDNDPMASSRVTIQARDG